MRLQEAKQVQIGEKLLVKATDQRLTVAGKTLYSAGIGYSVNTMVFEFEETTDKYTHQGLQRYKLPKI